MVKYNSRFLKVEFFFSDLNPFTVVIMDTIQKNKNKILPQFSFGFCSKISMNFQPGEYHYYFGSVYSGYDFDVTLSQSHYKPKLEPSNFCVDGKFKFDPKFDKRIQQVNRFKWIINCDNGTISFYWNNTIWNDGKYSIDKNQRKTVQFCTNWLHTLRFCDSVL